MNIRHQHTTWCGHTTKMIERTLGFMWTIEVLGRDPSDPYEEFEAVGLYADVEGVETVVGTEGYVEVEALKLGFTWTLF